MSCSPRSLRSFLLSFPPFRRIPGNRTAVQRPTEGLSAVDFTASLNSMEVGHVVLVMTFTCSTVQNNPETRLFKNQFKCEEIRPITGAVTGEMHQSDASSDHLSYNHTVLTWWDHLSTVCVSGENTAALQKKKITWCQEIKNHRMIAPDPNPQNTATFSQKTNKYHSSVDYFDSDLFENVDCRFITQQS